MVPLRFHQQAVSSQDMSSIPIRDQNSRKRKKLGFRSILLSRDAVRGSFIISLHSRRPRTIRTYHSRGVGGDGQLRLAHNFGGLMMSIRSSYERVRKYQVRSSLVEQLAWVVGYDTK